MVCNGACAVDCKWPTITSFLYHFTSFMYYLFRLHPPRSFSNSPFLIHFTSPPLFPYTPPMVPSTLHVFPLPATVFPFHYQPPACLTTPLPTKCTINQMWCKSVSKYGVCDISAIVNSRNVTYTIFTNTFTPHLINSMQVQHFTLHKGR